MTLEETLSEHGAWLLVVVACVAFAYHMINRLNHQAGLFRQAHRLTSAFYAKVDDLMTCPDLSDYLKSVMYDLLMAVTKEENGRLALRAIMQTVNNDSRIADGGANRISEEVAALRRVNADVADDFDEALRLAFAAVICGHGHTEQSLTVAIVKGSERQSLAQSVATIRNTIAKPQLAMA